MTNETLVLYSNLSFYSAIVVLTLAMVAFAIDVARAATRASATRTNARERIPVPAGSSSWTDDPTGSGPTAPTAPTASHAIEPAARTAAGIAMSMTWLAGTLLVAGVVMRGLSVMRVPWGNMFEFATTGSTVVILCFLTISLSRDLRWLGLFVVGPTLLTLGLAVTVYYTAASQLLPALKSFWLVIHVSVSILAVAFFTIAFSVTILFLVKVWLERIAPDRLSRAERAVAAALPSSGSLDQTAYGLHVLAFPLWTFTLIAGAIWAEQAWGAYWQWDPKEVWTFVIWVVYAAYLHARATTGWSRQRSAYLALAGYGCVLINFMVVNVFFVGMHSYSGM